MEMEPFSLRDHDALRCERSSLHTDRIYHNYDDYARSEEASSTASKARNTWKRWFHEDGINTYLSRYFDEKIKKMADTYPNTEYGCTTMYRNGYFFNLNIYLLCIYS
ncbi:unnamed protein product [Nippostrongylus brasiliensis]|uniref:SCP domain-containing protein n=1 Tax=Nippostrongylus brasiliensis TaxID=27835 RepID=A0A0N4Y5P4_NIPBR|nr:unnamed protein product [Nippostrongylus brasiliensis]